MVPGMTPVKILDLACSCLASMNDYCNSEQNEQPRETSHSVSSHTDHMVPTQRLLLTPEQTECGSSQQVYKYITTALMWYDCY